MQMIGALDWYIGAEKPFYKVEKLKANSKFEYISKKVRNWLVFLDL